MELCRKSTSLPFHHFAQWAHNCPGQIALIEYETGKQVMYKQLARKIDITTYRLLELGVVSGDRVATAIPFSVEYVCLMIASWRVGAIFSPMNHKLPLSKHIEQLSLIEPKIFVFHKPLPVHTKKHLKTHCPYINQYIYIKGNSQSREQNSFAELCQASRLGFRYLQQRYHHRLKRASKEQHLWSPALILFKEEEPLKAVLLSHNNLLHQIKNNRELFGLGPYDKTLVSLPPNHAGGVITALLSAIGNGATAVLCADFASPKTKSAIEKHYITHLFQRTSDYEDLWLEKDKNDFDSSCLRFAVTIDEAPDLTFISRLESFTQEGGFGLFLAEAGGFVSFTSTKSAIATFYKHLGAAIPKFSQLSIREPNTENKRAGEPIPEGFVGEVCIESASIFLGYFNNLEATSKALCKEGILYTGLHGRLVPYQNQLFLSLSTNEFLSNFSSLTA